MSLKKIKKALIDFYLNVKIRKIVDINNLSDESFKEEEKYLNELPIMDIINYLSNSFEILSEIKAQEKYEEKLIEDKKKKNFIILRTKRIRMD